MQIVVLDDEILMLKSLTKAVTEAEPSAEVHCFQSSPETLEYARNHEVDVFFLDIQMPEMDGVTLAREIKLIQPRANVIFSTGYSEYMPDAFLLNVSGYLLKPITTERVREQLDILRYPIQAGPTDKIRLQCFGNFEVFRGKQPIVFKHSKTKELLAYLTSRRGAMCTNNEIIAALWEEGSHESYLRDLRKDLLETLGKNGDKDIILVKRGQIGLDIGQVECDYYQWLNGIVSGINAYHGEFMAQYSWAEFVNASLQEKY